MTAIDRPPVRPASGMSAPARRRASATAAVAGFAVLIAGLAGWVRWTAVRGEAIRRAYEVHVAAGREHAAETIERLGTLPPVLGESSGVAVSRIQPGVLWSHNDSGDGPTLYAVDRTGRLLATVAVSGADARDWEDIDVGVCPATAAARDAGATEETTAPSCLYVADTGDNGGVRTIVTVYVLPEPILDPARRAPAVPARAVSVRYPQGPDDCEALAVLPGGDLLLVTKGRRGTIGFYRLRAADVARAAGSGEVLTAEYDGPADIEPDARIGRMVTGASFWPGGTLALRTYDEIVFYRADPAAAAGRRWARVGPPCFLDYDERLGEGVAFLDGDTLVLTAEGFRGRPGGIHRVRCGSAAIDGGQDSGRASGGAP